MFNMRMRSDSRGFAFDAGGPTAPTMSLNPKAVAVGAPIDATLVGAYEGKALYFGETSPRVPGVVLPGLDPATEYNISCNAEGALRLNSTGSNFTCISTHNVCGGILNGSAGQCCFGEYRSPIATLHSAGDLYVDGSAYLNNCEVYGTDLDVSGCTVVRTSESVMTYESCSGGGDVSVHTLVYNGTVDGTSPDSILVATHQLGGDIVSIRGHATETTNNVTYTIGNQSGATSGEFDVKIVTNDTIQLIFGSAYNNGDQWTVIVESL